MIHAPDGEAVLERATEIVEGGRGRIAERSATRLKKCRKAKAAEAVGSEATKPMVRPERFELPACCFGGNRSIQLSYGRTVMGLR